MNWGKQAWDPHGEIHFPNNDPWKSQVNRTLSGPAVYAPWVDIQTLELSAVAFVRDGDGKIVLMNADAIRRFKDGFHQVFLICDEIIGASEGKETKIILVQWDPEPDGTVHGHPITEHDLKQKLSGSRTTGQKGYRDLKERKRIDKLGRTEP